MVIFLANEKSMLWNFQMSEIHGQNQIVRKTVKKIHAFVKQTDFG